MRSLTINFLSIFTALIVNGATPDLTVIASPMLLPTGPIPGVSNSVFTFARTFSTNDCSVAEGCNLSGTRTLLTFSLCIANLGDETFLATAVFDKCHGHDHVPNLTQFRLLNCDGTVAAGKKMGTCLCSNLRIVGEGPCVSFGLGAGCGDLYGPSTPCQWIDVTDVRPGQYQFEVEVDPLDSFGLQKYNLAVNKEPDKVSFGIYLDGLNPVQVFPKMECIPAAPSVLTGTQSGHTVVLNWHAVTLAPPVQVYHIYKSIEGGEFLFYGTAPASATSFIDSDAKKNRRYCYHVTSLSNQIESQPSNPWCTK